MNLRQALATSGFVPSSGVSVKCWHPSATSRPGTPTATKPATTIDHAGADVIGQVIAGCRDDDQTLPAKSERQRTRARSDQEFARPRRVRPVFFFQWAVLRRAFVSGADPIARDLASLRCSNGPRATVWRTIIGETAGRFASRLDGAGGVTPSFAKRGIDLIAGRHPRARSLTQRQLQAGRQVLRRDIKARQGHMCEVARCASAGKPARCEGRKSHATRNPRLWLWRSGGTIEGRSRRAGECRCGRSRPSWQPRLPERETAAPSRSVFQIMIGREAREARRPPRDLCADHQVPSSSC